MTKGLAISAGFFVATMSSFASAATLRVPQTYPSIQSAVDAARPNDMVLVAPGTYFENVHVSKPLKLVSTQGAARTIVDANHYRSALTIRGNNVPSEFVTVRGFTFTHGEFTMPPTPEFPDPTGTGIDAAGMNVVIDHNIIEDNLSCEAGMLVTAKKSFVTDNVVRNNSGNWMCAFRGAGMSVGGSFDFDEEAVIERNDVYGNAGVGINSGALHKLTMRFNHSHHNGGTGAFGPGIAIDTVSGEISNNVIDHNTSSRGSAMSLIMATDDPIPNGLSMLVTNNLMLNNVSTLLNDGEPNDGSVVIIDSYTSRGIKFIGNTVITPTPAPLIYCIRERENAYPVLIGNILSNNAGAVFSEDCHRP